MRNVLLAMIALFALTATPIVYAEDQPEAQGDVQADEASVALPPLTDSGDAN
jgi:hypothetical protein